MSYYSKYTNDLPDYQAPMVESSANEFLKRVNTIIIRHLDDEEFASVPLSEEMGISRSQLFRKIKEYSGFSTALYIRHIRMQKSADLLLDPSLSIRIVAFAVGFKDVAYFSRCFKQTFKRSPSQFRSETLQISI